MPDPAPPMNPDRSQASSLVPGEGVLATVRAAISAGALTGLLFGLADGITAACCGTADLELLALCACLAASVALYSFLWVVVLVVVGLALHPWAKRRSL